MQTANYVGAGATQETERITISGYPGETAVIDGQYTYPGGSVYYFLVTIGSKTSSGKYITLRNVIVKRSSGSLLILAGDYCNAINVTGNGSRESGIVAAARNNLIDGCTMTDNGNGYGIGGQGTWGSAICTVGSNTTIQKCISHDNMGEGINAYSSSSNSIIQDNISYNNKSCNLYLDSSTGSLVQRNIVYASPGWNLSSARGIFIGAETGQASNLTIINNFAIGNFVNFETDSNLIQLTNVTVAYNTFVNARGNVGIGYNMGVYFRNNLKTFTNSFFKNNIILEEASDHVPISVPSSHSGLTFSYNNWNKIPVTAARGTGDVIGDPKITKAIYGPGTLTSNYFKIYDASPAKDAGSAIEGITTDYFGNTRPQGSAPDMGAHEIYEIADQLLPPSGLRVIY